ncbi:Zinc finger protein ZXDC [Camelus dromedarius]|uniref:Zinc finger protein ZXDC n=1 Tax=Camelus dromedarius TaxID=9838 RepID=A0A5N4CYB7_CAMDR|nr:Zinc finger protein ZXDC [Camelus dromedarius]
MRATSRRACSSRGVRERFPTHAKLSSHQRSHFEPERPYKCDFPGCEKTFITVSALFSHNRAHFREQELFSCSFPGCSKQYDKACRLKIHLRSHTGERPFVCDSDSCGWTFTSMSKLLRHKRKHEDDRRFTCPVEGCGKSFTRAEHLKGHSVTHLGTKPFVCPVEGCCARFSARSSLYIHSKKHLQDVAAPKSRCPVSSCDRLFTSKHSMKAHMVRQHRRPPDLFPPLAAPTSSLGGPTDLAALFSDPPGEGGGAAGAPDEVLSAGILTIDVTSVSSSLGGSLPASHGSLGPMDPLVLVAHSDVPPSLDGPLVLGTAAAVLQPSSFVVDDVQAAGALGCLLALPLGNLSQDPQALTASSSPAASASLLTSVGSPQGSTSVPELLVPIKVESDLPPGPDAAGRPQHSGGAARPVEEPSPQRDVGRGAGTGSLYLLCDAGLPQFPEHRWRVVDGPQVQPSPAVGLLKVGAQQELTPEPLSKPRKKSREELGATQDAPVGDVVLPVALSPQPPALHPLFAVDVPIYALQEALPAAGGASGPEDVPSLECSSGRR